MQSFSRQLSCPAVRRILADGHTRPRPRRFLHATPAGQAPRKRNFFSSNAVLQQELVGSNETAKDLYPTQKRKPIRSPAGKTSLRRVAVEAQRSRENTLRRKNAVAG